MALFHLGEPVLEHADSLQNKPFFKLFQSVSHLFQRRTLDKYIALMTCLHLVLFSGCCVNTHELFIPFYIWFRESCLKQPCLMRLHGHSVGHIPLSNFNLPNHLYLTPVHFSLFFFFRTEDKCLIRIILMKTNREAGNCWSSLLEGEYCANAWVQDQMQKKLTLERFQREVSSY